MSARSLNQAMIIGNLTRDPNLRFTPSNTAVCSFGVATNRSWVNQDSNERQEKTEFHNIVAWGKLAEICGNLLHKGDKVFVQGRLQTRDWKTADGVEKRITEIVIDDMVLLKSQGGSSRASDNNYASDDQGDDSSSQDDDEGADEDSESSEAEDVSDEIPF